MWCGRSISNMTPPLTAVRSRSYPPSMTTPANGSAASWSGPSRPSGWANELDDIVADRGVAPRVLRLDNGPEMIAVALAEWAGTCTGMLFIPPGEPWRNPFIEAFHGRLPIRRLVRTEQCPVVTDSRGRRRIPAQWCDVPAGWLSGARLTAALTNWTEST